MKVHRISSECRGLKMPLCDVCGGITVVVISALTRLGVLVVAFLKCGGFSRPNVLGSCVLNVERLCLIVSIQTRLDNTWAFFKRWFNYRLKAKSVFSMSRVFSSPLPHFSQSSAEL